MINIKTRDTQYKYMNWVWFILVISITVLTSSSLRKKGVYWVEAPDEQKIRWEPELFKFVSFTHWPAAIDFIWIKAWLDPAYTAVKEGTHPPVFFDLDLITSIEPFYFNAYVLGANYLAIIRDDQEGAIDLLKKGLSFYKADQAQWTQVQKEHWSKQWWIPLTLGYIYIYEKDDIVQASYYLKQAAAVSSSPEYLKSLSEKLRSKEGQFEVALKLVDFMIQSQKEEKNIEQLKLKKRSLFLSQYFYELNKKFKALLSQSKAYREQIVISKKFIENKWKVFKKSNHIPTVDPWGGEIDITAEGVITSKTPREKILGLE